MIKEMDCVNYFPGDVRYLHRKDLDNLLRRDGRGPVIINGIKLGGTDDNQRQTMCYYLYAKDNLLGGK